ncbi:hypothetical protein SFC88_00955 [Nocardioides sp. HM23]|nr:hypothetical protein [Nocardioides sp. HM23]MDZ5619370.1 hypothetical protein [Nocardioides sp. HM23]
MEPHLVTLSSRRFQVVGSEEGDFDFFFEDPEVVLALRLPSAKVLPH